MISQQKSSIDFVKALKVKVYSVIAGFFLNSEKSFPKMDGRLFQSGRYIPSFTIPPHTPPFAPSINTLPSGQGKWKVVPKSSI
jgi:hypothetical protein